ncbi:hypothetical protein PS947_02081 [Pseudomonas fluorescens]|nr:hypothetical protein PS947_02081 [Pseudomonas fluorescens]
MKHDCTDAQGAVTEGRMMESPVSLGENFENVSIGLFSKTRTIFFGWQLPVCGGGLSSPMAHMRQGLQESYRVSEDFTPPQRQPFEGEAGRSSSEDA